MFQNELLSVHYLFTLFFLSLLSPTLKEIILQLTARGSLWGPMSTIEGSRTSISYSTLLRSLEHLQKQSRTSKYIKQAILLGIDTFKQ
jgi:hypothetical protein